MTGKTIKQIADELGVTKQAVHQKRKKLSTNLEPFTTTVDGTIYISIDGENLLKEAFGNEGRKHVDDNVNDNGPSTERQQIDALCKVILAQQQTIDNLTEIIKQEQTLHAASKGMLLAEKATAAKRLKYLFRGRL